MKGSLPMKSKYLDSAIQQIPGPELLINLVSRRVRQLTQGHRPMTQTDPKMDYTDIALKEITEGKIGYELPTGPEVLHQSSGPEV
jgi:DNA-directed RNA polymerase subunit omega